MGGKFDKACGKRIKLDQKCDEIGYHRVGSMIGYRNRISESESDIRIGYHSDRSEISESDRISYELHGEFLDSLYKVRDSVNPYFFFCLWALFPLCSFPDSYEKNIVKFLVCF